LDTQFFITLVNFPGGHSSAISRESGNYYPCRDRSTSSPVFISCLSIKPFVLRYSASKSSKRTRISTKSSKRTCGKSNPACSSRVAPAITIIPLKNPPSRLRSTLMPVHLRNTLSHAENHRDRCSSEPPKAPRVAKLPSRGRGAYVNLFRRGVLAPMYTRRAACRSRMDSSVSPPPHKLCTRLVGWSLGRSVIHHGGSSPRTLRERRTPRDHFRSRARALVRDSGGGGGGARRGIISIRRAWWALRVPERAFSQGPDTEDLCLPAPSDGTRASARSEKSRTEEVHARTVGMFLSLFTPPRSENVINAGNLAIPIRIFG